MLSTPLPCLKLIKNHTPLPAKLQGARIIPAVSFVTNGSFRNAVFVYIQRSA